MVIKLGTHAELPWLKIWRCYFASFYVPGGEEGAPLCTKVQRDPANGLCQGKATLTCPRGAALTPHIRCMLSLSRSPFGRPRGWADVWVWVQCIPASSCTQQLPLWHLKPHFPCWQEKHLDWKVGKGASTGLTEAGASPSFTSCRCACVLTTSCRQKWNISTCFPALTLPLACCWRCPTCTSLLTALGPREAVGAKAPFRCF